MAIESTDLPALRTSRYCVLMPKDPATIFAYWDINPDDVRRKPGQLVLRVYEISNKNFWDLDLVPASKNCYIKVRRDNAEYYVALGLKNSAHRFSPLLRSNHVRTPSQTLSKRNDLIWQDIKEEQGTLAFIKEKTRARRKYFLTPQDIEAYYKSFSIENILKGRLGKKSWVKTQAQFLTQRAQGASSSDA